MLRSFVSFKRKEDNDRAEEKCVKHTICISTHLSTVFDRVYTRMCVCVCVCALRRIRVLLFVGGVVVAIHISLLPFFLLFHFLRCFFFSCRFYYTSILYALASSYYIVSEKSDARHTVLQSIQHIQTYVYVPYSIKCTERMNVYYGTISVYAVATRDDFERF